MYNCELTFGPLENREAPTGMGQRTLSLQEKNIIDMKNYININERDVRNVGYEGRFFL